jgi:hypothetical protein
MPRESIEDTLIKNGAKHEPARRVRLVLGLLPERRLGTLPRQANDRFRDHRLDGLATQTRRVRSLG